ncbi:MAG: phosphopantetheine--protein transferase [Gammaproteobacteria bacterium]|nr:phosphopantetheine--protein transferase [Gammaproteobacteria bacterium]
MSGLWHRTPAKLRLSETYIDIWRTSLNLTRHEIDACLALLSPDEIARANRFKVKRKYREYIISRGLLRRILGLTLGTDPADFEFEYSEHDKPLLNLIHKGAPVTFNVSHSHEQTLIAVTLGHALGIDIEQVRQDVQFRQLAKRFFSAQEARELETYTEAGIPRAFFACWTRKEAFVKALGDGIAFGLNEFSVSVNPFDDNVALTTHWDPEEAGNWSLLNIHTDADYIAALAVAGQGFKIRYWEF